SPEDGMTSVSVVTVVLVAPSDDFFESSCLCCAVLFSCWSLLSASILSKFPLRTAECASVSSQKLPISNLGPNELQLLLPTGAPKSPSGSVALAGEFLV